jgi:hypothetical protein
VAFLYHPFMVEKEGRELSKAEKWPASDNTVANPELSVL